MRSIGQGNRLGTAIYADTSDPHRLSVGLIGGDIPIFPPFAFLLSIGMALMLWSLTHKRYRIVPSHSLYMRGATMAVGVALAMGLANAVEVELIRVGTIANFANVAKIATQGPFAYTRNGMYLTAFPFFFFPQHWIGYSLVCSCIPARDDGLFGSLCGTSRRTIPHQ